MNVLSGDRWKRKGITVLWDPTSLAQVAAPGEVLTLREFVKLSQAWPDADALPGGGDRLVVAGVKGVLEVLASDDAGHWLERDFRRRIIAFQDRYEGEVALVLWFPSAGPPFKMSPADETYTWSPHGRAVIPFGRHLWTGAERDVERIVVGDGIDADGPGWVGLFHPRIS